MHKPKSKGEPLHRNRKTLQRAISVNPIKRDNRVEGTKRCFDRFYPDISGAQHDMRGRCVLKLPTISHQLMMYHSVTQSLQGVSQRKSVQSASSAFHFNSRSTNNYQRPTSCDGQNSLQKIKKAICFFRKSGFILYRYTLKMKNGVQYIPDWMY